MWLISTILVALLSWTSDCARRLTLTPSNPMATFQTSNYPGFHDAKEKSTWVVSAPGNVIQMNLMCDIEIHYSVNCSEAFFSFYDYDKKIIHCETTKISQNLRGSTTVIKFVSSMSKNTAYKGLSCTVSYNPKDIPTSTTPVDPFCKCGQQETQRIYGGDEAIPHEFPWQALLMHRSSQVYFCGGSLIAKEWILSASHCLDNIHRPSSMIVILGEHNYQYCDPATHNFNVADIFRHENYKQTRRFNNDIALLKLKKPALFNQFISPICLPFNYKYYDFTDKTAITSGWGRTFPNDENSASNVLRKVPQKIIMPSKCTVLDGYDWFQEQITENMLCAPAHNGGHCKGDSGGPLVWESDSSNLYFLVGVVSFGSGARNSNKPLIYTRVSQYLDWIVNKTGAGEEFCVKN